MDSQISDGLTNGRISMVEYGLKLAQLCAERSEDPWRKVGAVGFTMDNRIIAMGYNGFLKGSTWQEFIEAVTPWRTKVPTDQQRELRRPYMVHAEQNLCSLVKRDELHWVAVTHNPCSSCLLLLATHGVRTIHYLEEYETDETAVKVAKFYNITMNKHELATTT
jgi:dCMP deaminase